MKKLLPIVFLLLGLAGGGGAAFAIYPPEVAQPAGDSTPAEPEGPSEYVKFNNQFVVPVVQEGRVQSMVILSVSLDVTQGSSARVYAVEPKLRDLILQELFNHANHGGFAGTFTSAAQMEALRKSLYHVISDVLGSGLRGVLITDIARQDSA